MREVPDLLLSLPSDKRRPAGRTDTPARPSALDRIDVNYGLVTLSGTERDMVEAEFSHLVVRVFYQQSTGLTWPEKSQSSIEMLETRFEPRAGAMRKCQLSDESNLPSRPKLDRCVVLPCFPSIWPGSNHTSVARNPRHAHDASRGRQPCPRKPEDTGGSKTPNGLKTTPTSRSSPSSPGEGLNPWHGSASPTRTSSSPTTT
jgi:hypothetical protein